MTKNDDTKQAPAHTPGPWDCDARTTMYATADESAAMTMIEIRGNVTEAGWDTVAFIEATWPAHMPTPAASSQPSTPARASSPKPWTKALSGSCSKGCWVCWVIFHQCKKAFASIAGASTTTSFAATVPAMIAHHSKPAPPSPRLALSHRSRSSPPVQAAPIFGGCLKSAASIWAYRRSKPGGRTASTFIMLLFGSLKRHSKPPSTPASSPPARTQSRRAPCQKNQPPTPHQPRSLSLRARLSCPARCTSACITAEPTPVRKWTIGASPARPSVPSPATSTPTAAPSASTGSGVPPKSGWKSTTT